MRNTRNWIKRIREKLHLTQNQLAERIGVSTREVSRWENGHAEPFELAVKQLIKLAQKAGLN